MSNGRKRGYRFTHPETGIEYVFDGAMFVPVDSAAGLGIIGESAASESRAPDGSEEQSGLAGFARTAAQGATFGLSDELAGLVARLPGGKTSEEATAAARQNLAQYRKAHPGMAIGAEVLGGLATGLLVPGGAARVIPTLGRGLRSARVGQRALAGMGLGTAEGALYGAGSADEGGRIGGAAKGALIGGLLGGGIGAVMPAPTGWVGGGRAPTRGGQALESVEAARGGPRRAPARAPKADPADIPVTPIGQQVAPPAQPSLLGRAQQGVAQSRVGQAVGRRVGQAGQAVTTARHGLAQSGFGQRVGQARQAAGQRVEQAVQSPVGQAVIGGAQRVGGVATGPRARQVAGLLRPSAWGAEATEQALRPVTRAGSRRLGELDTALDAASGTFKKLDDSFPTGWGNSKRPKMGTARLDALNQEAVDVVQEISKHPKVKMALSSAHGTFKDMTSIGKLRNAVKFLNGKLRPAKSVPRLAHKEVKALWQNLRHMSGEVEEADVLFNKLDDVYRRLYGKGTDRATKGYREAIQDVDSYLMGSQDGAVKVAGRRLARPKMFSITKLRTTEGLKRALREISRHGGVGDKQRVMGNFMEGLFDKEVRLALTNSPDQTLKKLAENKEWLRMFFKPGKNGDKAFNGAWKEVQALAKAGGKKKGWSRTAGLLGGGALLGTSGAFIWNLFD